MGRGGGDDEQTVLAERLLYGRPLARSAASPEALWSPERDLIEAYRSPGKPVWLSDATDSDIFWIEGGMGSMNRASTREGKQHTINVGENRINALLSAGTLDDGNEFLVWRGASSGSAHVGFLDAGGTTVSDAFPTGYIEPEVFSSGNQVYAVAAGQRGIESRCFTREGASDAVYIEIGDGWSPSEILDSGSGKAGPQVLVATSRDQDGGGGLALISLEDPREVVQIPGVLLSQVAVATLIPADEDRGASVMARTLDGSVVYWGGDPERGFETISDDPADIRDGSVLIRDDQARDRLLWIEKGETPLRRNLRIAECSSGQITRKTITENLPRLNGLQAVAGKDGAIDISWSLEDDFRQTTIKIGSWNDGKITGEATLAESGKPIAVERLIPNRESGSLRAILREELRPRETASWGIAEEAVSRLFQKIRRYT